MLPEPWGFLVAITILFAWRWSAISHTSDRNIATAPENPAHRPTSTEEK